MHHRDDARLLDRAALALFAGQPSALLLRAVSVSKKGMVSRPKKATVKSWRQGRRRAPLSVLRQLRLMLQARAAECNDLWRDFGNEIARREGESPSRRGFMEIRVREPGGLPRDGRNRRGRPKRHQ